MITVGNMKSKLCTELRAVSLAKGCVAELIEEPHIHVLYSRVERAD